MDQIEVIEGRSCKNCTLCCKVMGITALDKPKGQWCPKCAIGKGCRIYESRPNECHTFYCGYLTWPGTPEHWFPAKSKMIIVSELDGERIAIHIDPSTPLRWKDQPYYEEIKWLAEQDQQDSKQLLVCCRGRVIAVFPDKDIDLGKIGPEDRIITYEKMTSQGPKWFAEAMHKDDPKLEGMKDGILYTNQ